MTSARPVRNLTGEGYSAREHGASRQKSDSLRICCHTAAHDPGCPCWRCVALAMADELDAVEYEHALPEVKPAAKPSPKPKPEAPQVTLDALLYVFRTQGKAAFNEPANRERLSRLSPRQREQLREIVARNNKQTVPA